MAQWGFLVDIAFSTTVKITLCPETTTTKLPFETLSSARLTVKATSLLFTPTWLSVAVSEDFSMSLPRRRRAVA